MEGRGFFNSRRWNIHYRNSDTDNSAGTTSKTKQPCSIDYLHLLYLELARARAFVLLNTTDLSSVEKQQERLEYLSYEFVRLFQNPSLFLSPAVKARFMALCFHLDSEYNFLRACTDLLVNKQIRAVQKQSSKLLTRHTFASGSVGWENFLMPNGSSTQLWHENMETASAYQVLPGVGMRICSDFLLEENENLSFASGVSAFWKFSFNSKVD